MTDVRLVLDARAALGEGPRWDARDGRLLWVDIDSGLLHRFDPRAGTDETLEVGTEIGVAVPHQDGGYLAAVRDGFATVGQDGTTTLVADVGAPGLRMNDGICAPDGSFWAGTMAFDRTPGAGSLYRLSPEGTVSVALTGVTISNGLAFSPDGGTLYYVDTPTRRVDVFDVDGARLFRRRTLAVLSDGRPDGLALDHEGGIWVAAFRGGAIHRYAPDGTLDAKIELPVACPTSCAFGDEDGGTLYVTTATPPDGVARSPYDGALFAFRPGVTGPAALPYRPQRTDSDEQRG
jgi:sugar lactone lactonase YvrE